jgi:hypothetical protein
MLLMKCLLTYVLYTKYASPTQVLSMSRLGGTAAVAPLVADMSSEVTCSFSLYLQLFPHPKRGDVNCQACLCTLDFSRTRRDQRDVNELFSATADGYCHATVPRVPHREMTRLPSPPETTTITTASWPSL